MSIYTNLYFKKSLELFKEVEGYDEMIRNPDTKYYLHHREETFNERGELLKKCVRREELLELGRYYNLEPKDYIYLSSKEHAALHSCFKTQSCLIIPEKVIEYNEKFNRNFKIEK